MLDVLELQTTYNNLMEQLQSLPQAFSDVVYFKFIEEKDYKEIAALLATSEENVRQRLSRALKMLRSKL